MVVTITTLSPLQESLLRLLRQFIEADQRPCHRDLGRCQFPAASTSVVAYNLARLEEMGLVRKLPAIARSVSLTPAGWAHLGTPPALRAPSPSLRDGEGEERTKAWAALFGEGESVSDEEYDRAMAELNNPLQVRADVAASLERGRARRRAERAG